MIPQDGRSPIQQQRWVEIYNGSGETIPAHGIVEIVSNETDEDEFRTFMTATQPTADGIPNVMINSPKEIPAGEYGWATDDGPTYALGSGASVGEMVGSQSGSFSFKRGVPGFVVKGTGAAPGTTTQRIKFCWVGEIDALAGNDFCPTDLTAAVSGAEFGVATLPTITLAINPFRLSALTGDPILLKWKCSLQQWEVAQTKKYSLKTIRRVFKDGCAIKQDYSYAYVDYCGYATETAVAFTEIDVMDDMGLFSTDGSGAGSGSGSGDQCYLSKSKVRLCVLEAGTSSQSVALYFTPVEVVVSAYFSEELGCLYELTQFVYVPCVRDGSISEILCADPCDSGSGS